MYYQEIKSVRVKQAHNQFFAGYLAYWKLIIETEKMRKSNKQYKLLTYTQKVKVVFFLMFKYIFAATIKPLKQFYSYSTYLNGVIEVDKVSGVITKNSLVKIRFFKLFGVVFFKKNVKLTLDEIREIIK